MDFDFFASSIMKICSHAQAAAGRELRWTIITNPKAGGFTIKKRWRRHEAALRSYIQLAAALPERTGQPSRTAAEYDTGTSSEHSPAAYGLIFTNGPGHAQKITGSLIDEIRSEKALYAQPFHLIITAGGDGTSLEVLTGLYHAGADVLSNCAVLRLPMGTGNDGADAWELDGALDLLLNEKTIGRARALKLTTATNKGPFLAFNILSVGLDAFVTHMTNKMKGNLPGDSYKLWVDIASLLYDRLYHVGHLDIRALDYQGREVKSFREKLILLAVGASGNRSYGSHNYIVPDERNVCALRQMSVFRKIYFKDLFVKGAHVDKKESILFNAARVEFRGEYPILAQMDGETVLLSPEDFPAAIELSEKIIPILRADGELGKKR